MTPMRFLCVFVFCFLLSSPTPQPQARLSYLGGSGVEGGQGSNDYNYGESTVLGPRSCAGGGSARTLSCRPTPRCIHLRPRHRK
jgi:hypothetical protein